MCTDNPNNNTKLKLLIRVVRAVPEVGVHLVPEIHGFFSRITPQDQIVPDIQVDEFIVRAGQRPGGVVGQHALIRCGIA